MTEPRQGIMEGELPAILISWMAEVAGSERSRTTSVAAAFL